MTGVLCGMSMKALHTLRYESSSAPGHVPKYSWVSPLFDAACMLGVKISVPRRWKYENWG